MIADEVKSKIIDVLSELDADEQNRAIKEVVASILKIRAQEVDLLNEKASALQRANSELVKNIV